MYNNGRLFALDATNGTSKWTSRINNNGYSDGLSATPALVGGILYNGSTDSAIYAIDAYTGVQKWRVPIDRNPFAHCSPLVKNNVLYYAAYDTVFYALNAGTGQQIWRRKFGREFDFTPVTENDVLYMVNNGGIYALDAIPGSTLWSYIPGSGYFLNGPMA